MIMMINWWNTRLQYKQKYGNTAVFYSAKTSQIFQVWGKICPSLCDAIAKKQDSPKYIILAEKVQLKQLWKHIHTFHSWQSW